MCIANKETLKPFLIFASHRIAFNTTEDCAECSRLITSNETSCTKVDEFFAFQYFSQMKNEEMNLESLSLNTKQHPAKKTKSSRSKNFLTPI